MANLPDELWMRIMEIGIGKPNNLLNYKDLCCISITCKQLNKLSTEDSIWVQLISSDFPQFDAKIDCSSSNNTYPCSSKTLYRISDSSSSINPCPPSSKTLYKIRFERDWARKVAARNRAVLRVESRIAQHSRKLDEIHFQKSEEVNRMKATALELSNLRKARQASVALNVWQPEVVRSTHKQIVEQSPVPADARIHALEMELKLCKQQLTGLGNAYRDETRRLEAAKEQVASMKYHPLRVGNLTNDTILSTGVKRRRKAKELEYIT